MLDRRHSTQCPRHPAVWLFAFVLASLSSGSILLCSSSAGTSIDLPRSIRSIHIRYSLAETFSTTTIVLHRFDAIFINSSNNKQDLSSFLEARSFTKTNDQAVNMSHAAASRDFSNYQRIRRSYRALGQRAEESFLKICDKQIVS